MGCCHGLEIPPDEEILNCQSIDEVIKSRRIFKRKQIFR